MQVAQIIKMICAISNYPTNTMQTNRDPAGSLCLVGASLVSGRSGSPREVLTEMSQEIAERPAWASGSWEHSLDWGMLELGRTQGNPCS